MALNLLDAFDSSDLLSKEEKIKEQYLRAPIPYPGGKSRSVQYILPHLPYRDTYIEPFGGSAAVLLTRRVSKLEVYNDRYGGIVAFYRCIANKEKCNALMDRLSITITSREEFIWAKENWQNVEDDVERAALWFYIMNYSFAGLGRNFGRAVRGNGVMAGKVLGKLESFAKLHQRMEKVQVENQDWFDCIKDYDHRESVIYCDPPYVDSHHGTYKHEMNHDDHRKFIDTVAHCKGFVAVSGYANPLYDNQNFWTGRYEWDSYVSISPRAFTEGNGKEDIKDVDTRVSAREVLWIKE